MKNKKLKQTNDSAHLTQYGFTIREGSGPVQCGVSWYHCAHETPSHVVNDCHITPLLALTLPVVAEEYSTARPFLIFALHILYNSLRKLRIDRHRPFISNQLTIVHLFVNFTSNCLFH